MPSFVLAVWFAAITAAVTPLQRDQPVERDLSVGETQVYAIEAAAGDFLRVVVEQHGIDVAVAAYGPDKRQFAEIDAVPSMDGSEVVPFVARSAGTYTLEVRPSANAVHPGKYRVRIDAWWDAETYAAQLAAIKAADQAAANSVRSTAVMLATVDPARPLDDLAPLEAIVGDAHVVALGDATHGTHEFFQLKQRMIEYLVERKGFTALAVEASMPEAFDVNEYVLTGRGDPKKALGALYFWGWNTEEMLDIVEWMRRYNADPAHPKKVRFYGIGMQAVPALVKRTLAFFRKVDPAALGPSVHALDLLRNMFTEADFDELPPADRQKALDVAHGLVQRMDARKAEYVKKAGADAFALARQHAVLVGQNIEQRTDPWTLRDVFLAQNARWVLEREGPGAKVLLWTHNLHARAVPETTMGAQLRKALGRDDFVTIGFTFGKGSFAAYDVGLTARRLSRFDVTAPPAGTFEALMATPALPFLLFDVRHLSADNPLTRWLTPPRPMRNIGAVYDSAKPDRFFDTQPIRVAYDAVVFVNQATATRPGRGTPVGPLPRVPEPMNLGFEQVDASGAPPAWSGADEAWPFDYQITTDTVAHSGQRSAVIRRPAGRHYGEEVGTLTQTVNAIGYRGKRIRLQAFARKNGAATEAYVWISASQPFPADPPVVAHDRKPVTRSEWRAYVIEVTIPQTATELSYGLALVGNGEARIDDLSVEVIPSPGR